MRNFNSISSAVFISECEKHLKKHSNIFSRSTVAVNPKWLKYDFENQIRLKTNKLNELVFLAMLSYYIPQEVGVLLRLSISEKIEHNEDLSLLTFFLKGKGQMYSFLLDTQRWHSRSFFGILGNMKFYELYDKKHKKSHDFNLFSFVMKSKKKPKRTLRHRGYRDKGTLPEKHECHSLASGTREHYTLEISRQTHRDTLAFLQGFLE